MRVKYIYCLPVLLITGNFVFAQSAFTNLKNDVANNTTSISNIKYELSGLVQDYSTNKENYKTLYDGIGLQITQLGNQISFASYFLSLISFILTGIGIFLGWLINDRYNKIVKSKEQIEMTKNFIESHNSDLYEKIKRQDTENLLKRISRIPEDVTNICNLLLSRDLLPQDYYILRECLLKIINNETLTNYTYDEYKNQYITIMMQHFPYELMQDEELSSLAESHLQLIYLNAMFFNDIINVFTAVLKLNSEKSAVDRNYKSVILLLVENFYLSKHRLNSQIVEEIKKVFSKDSISLNQLREFLLKESSLAANDDYLIFINKITNKDTTEI